MTHRVSVRTLVVLGLAVISGREAYGDEIASDNASKSAYASEVDGAWKGQYLTGTQNGQAPPGTDNGGTGFGIWDFGGGSNQDAIPYGKLNHFIDGVDFPTTASNNIGSPAFGLANSSIPYSGDTANATRPFNQALGIGDIFSVDIDTPTKYEDVTGSSYPFVIISFRDITGANSYVMSAGDNLAYGPYPWVYRDANHLGTVASPEGNYGVDAGVGPIAPTAPSDGSSLSLEVTSATTGQIVFDGVPLDITFMAGLPTSIRFTLYSNFAEADLMGNPTGEHAFYFNNLQIESTGGGGLAGDYNGNNVIDAADYTVWRDALTAGSSSLLNDSTPGIVNESDFTYWRNHFGEMMGSGAGSSSALVPEPGAIFLMAVAGLCVAVFRRLRG